MSVQSSNQLGGLAGVAGGFAPLDSGLLVPNSYLGRTDWAAYTPTWTGSSSNPAIGNGTLSGRYKYLDPTTVAVRINIAMGSGTTYGSGVYSIALPVTSGSVEQVISGIVFDSSASLYYPLAGRINPSSTSIVRLGAGAGPISATVPITFAASDVIELQGIYEVA